jgi:putative intracellular protease/amidase
MLSELSNEWKSRRYLIALLVLLGLSTGVSTITINNVNGFSESQDPVEILLLLDHGYGGNVPFIMDIFERYGWIMTTTGLNKTLTSCSYLGYEQFTVDILMTEITDLSQYDAISIMPGNSHDLLRTNQTSLDLINNAASQDMVVSAWCKGVRVLAASDVINGKNITGNADYVAEYEAAGATFNELVPPIIDGNIVTGVRSRFYRTEMCEAIATAIGVYEPDGPSLVSATVTPQQGVIGTSINITAELTDITGIYAVNAKVFTLNETSGEKMSIVYVEFFRLNTTSVEGVYSGTLEDLEIGVYTIDIEASDLYLNEAIYEYAANISILNQTLPPDWSGLTQWIIPSAMIGTAGVVVLVLFLKRR